MVPPEQPEGTSSLQAYRLVVEDSEMEMRRRYTGEVDIPWTEGMSGSRFESEILRVKDGFTLPDVFPGRWRTPLSNDLVEYWNTDGSVYGDFGWVRFRSLDQGQEAACVKFREPLPLWPEYGQEQETTTDAYVMKRDTISLFDPRGSERGMPELEGSLTANFRCEYLAGKGASVQVGYTLHMRGQGVMRYFGGEGEEWILGEDETFYLDREEPCEMDIVRTGVRDFSSDASGTWTLVRDVFQETWYAESLESEAEVNESSAGAAGRSYDLELRDLPERENVRTFIANVMDYGATGDGTTLDTGAVNRAIEACSERGGGTVVFPPGIYLSGSVHMKSDITLMLEEGAVLRGTRVMGEYDPREDNPWSDYQDASHSYFHHSLIWGEDLENIAIVGPGMIDGSDAFDPWPGMETSPPPPWGWLLSTIMYQINEELFQRGAKPIAFKRCRNVLIKDVTILHAPDEAILVTGCEFVLVDGFKAREVRVDGIDPDGCRNVTITNSEIKSLDDAVAVKSGYALGYKMPCEGLWVKNSLLSTFVNALKIGTETVGDFRDIVFRDCAIRNIPGFPSFAGISMMSVDGGRLDGILFSDITMRNAGYPIFIRLGDRLRTPESPPIGSVENVLIRNILSTGGSGLGASLITAVPDSRLGSGIRLQDVAITCRGGGHLLSSYLPVPERRESDGVYPDPPYIVPGDAPAYGLFCRHVEGLELHNVHLGFERADRRAALILEDVLGLVTEGFEAERIPGSAPSVIVRE